MEIVVLFGMWAFLGIIGLGTIGVEKLVSLTEEEKQAAIQVARQAASEAASEEEQRIYSLCLAREGQNERRIDSCVADWHD